MEFQGSRIRWNSIFAFLSQLVRLLTNLLVFVGIARFYGPEVFGQFTIAHTLSTVFLLLADFGFDSLMTTEIARHRERAHQVAEQYISIKLIFALAATAMMMCIPLLKTFSPQTITLVEIFGFYVLVSSMNNFFFSLFKGLEELNHETTISIVVNLSLIVLLVILGMFHITLVSVALTFVATRIIGLILALRVMKKRINWQLRRFTMSLGKDAWTSVLVFGSLTLFGSLCMQLDTMMLAFLKSDYDVGVYQASFKLAALALLLPDIATAAFMPALSRLFLRDAGGWNELGRLLRKTFVFIALVVTSFLFVFADQVISLLYGDKRFAESIPILRIFAVIVFIRYLVEVHGLMLTTSNNQLKRMVVVVIAVVINGILNFAAIPAYGILGAAVVSLLTNVWIAIGYIWQTRNLFAVRVEDISVGWPIVVTAAITVIAWNLRLIPMIYTAPVMVLLLSSFFLFFGYSKRERAMVFALPNSK